MIQVWVLLKLMAQITHTEPGIAYHRSVNCHIYHEQKPLVPIQLDRSILEQPTVILNPKIQTLEDVRTWVTPEDFTIYYPKAHPALSYPFAA